MIRRTVWKIVKSVLLWMLKTLCTAVGVVVILGFAAYCLFQYIGQEEIMAAIINWITENIDIRSYIDQYVREMIPLVKAFLVQAGIV